MITILNLVAAGVLGAWAVRCIRRAARLIDDIRHETADDTTAKDAAAQSLDRGLDRLFTALGPPLVEPTPADSTPAGDDEWTRDMDRRIRRTARRRNTGPRKGEQQ